MRNSVPIVGSYFICAENIWQHKCIQEARIFRNVCLLHIRRSGAFIRSLVEKWYQRPSHYSNTIKCLNYIMRLKVCQCPLNSQIKIQCQCPVKLHERQIYVMFLHVFLFMLLVQNFSTKIVCSQIFCCFVLQW